MAAAERPDQPTDSISAANTVKPKLKISLKNTSRQASFSAATPTSALHTPRVGLPSAASPPPATPSTEGQPKIIRLKSHNPSTPADGAAPPIPATSRGTAEQIAAVSAPVPAVTKTKAGRTSRPTPKKRAKQEDDSDDGPSRAKSGGRPVKKIKFTGGTPTITTAPGLPSASHAKSGNARPHVVVKNKGKKPPRPPGHGYDSEAEDREEDPVIEEQFILRMLPGEHTDYIRKAIQEKKIGVSRQQSGADIALKWLDEQSRRACLTVEGQPYAGVLLDLPTITEGMKTWNKKAFVKSADICQMLLVFAKVKNENEAKEAPLPPMVGKGYTWPHGLTPPMHDCVHRRFRKRLSKLEIQNKEEEVSRLLQADKIAMLSKWEMVDDRPQEYTMDESEGEEFSGEEEDAEGEVDIDADADAEGDEDDIGYFPPVNGYHHEMPDEDQIAALAAEVEAEFHMDLEMDMDSGTPAAGIDANTPFTANTGTPFAHTEGSGADGDVTGEADGGGDEDDGDDDDDDDEELDEDEQARADEVKGVREDAAELRKQLAKLQSDLAKQGNALLRKRIEGNIKKVKSELQLKLSSIGEVFEE